METNKTDEIFRTTFKDRKIQPSESSWERLNEKLDLQETKKKKKRFVYFGYAASILLLISLGVFQNFEKTPETKTEIIPLEQKIIAAESLENDSLKIDEEIITYNTTPLKAIPSEEIVQKEITHSENTLHSEEFFKNPFEIEIARDTSENTVIANRPLEKPENTFSIDANLLLESVTKELELASVKEEYSLETKEKLRLIQEEFDKQNINYDPLKMLAEIEKDIDNERTFKEKIMLAIKNNFKNLKTAIADRNK